MGIELKTQDVEISCALDRAWDDWIVATISNWRLKTPNPILWEAFVGILNRKN